MAKKKKTDNTPENATLSKKTNLMAPVPPVQQIQPNPQMPIQYKRHRRYL